MTDSVRLHRPVKAASVSATGGRPVRLLGWLAGLGIGSSILIMIGASLVRQDWMYPPVAMPASGPPFELHVHVAGRIVALALWLAALLAERGAPTAIVTNSDYTAHAVYKAARELSLPVGPGVSVVGHDDLPTSELLDPPLATIRMDHRAMGTALMQRLLEPGPADDYIAAVELVERASLQSPDAQLPARTDGQWPAATTR